MTLLSNGRTNGLGVLHKADGSTLGTSIFDPVLMECALKWWCPRPAKRDHPVVVIDPFAGGPVRGIVAAACGLLYVGIDISERQVEANRQQLQHVMKDALHDIAHEPIWIHGDGEDVVQLVRAELQKQGLDAPTPADFVVSCPPYYNLEKYDCGPADLSMLPTYAAFQDKYARIIKQAASLLKPKHMAVFVVGNVRSPSGETHLLHHDTINAFNAAGCKPYNDAVLKTALGNAPMRAERTMRAGSKLVSTHQNVLCFFKGDSFTNADARALGIRSSEDDAQRQRAE